MYNDLCYAIRMLLKSPGFTAVAVLMLALGIGANTAIFSMLEAIEGKTLPVRDPQQLVTVGVTRPGGGEARGIPYAMFCKLRDGNEVFSGMVTQVDDGVNLSADGKSERVMVEWVWR